MDHMAVNDLSSDKSKTDEDIQYIFRLGKTYGKMKSDQNTRTQAHHAPWIQKTPQEQLTRLQTMRHIVFAHFWGSFCCFL